jgi:hypothetical protein
MKNVLLKVVAVFEIICALGGGFMIYQASTGEMPYEVVPALWFGLFPLLSLIAGIALLLNLKRAVPLSIIVLTLQIPLILINGFTILRVAIALNLYLSAVWNARSPGGGPTVLGINALAIAMLVVLMTSRSAATGNEVPNSASGN